MRNTFVRMTPDIKNMVVQTAPYGSTDILCVECGWEGETFVEGGEEVKFKQHPCRLVSQMTSTLE